MATPRAQNITRSRIRRRPGAGLTGGAGATPAAIGLVGAGMTVPSGARGLDTADGLIDAALNLVGGLPYLQADAIRQAERGGRSRHDRSDELRSQRAAQVVERGYADHVDPPTA